jgi:FkbM family methyltransferase
MRPTARTRGNLLLRTMAKVSRQYLKWFENASYKPEKNGERWLLESLRNEPIRTVLDVGANVGKWSRMAAELLPQAVIYALEVVPATAEELRRNMAEQQRIKCFALGLAEHSGTLTIRYNPVASAHSTMTEYPHTWEAQSVECPVLRGDEFLATQAIRDVDFLKIDVEGAEHLVLRGFEQLLRERRVRFVQFEYGRVNILTRFLLKDFHDLFAQHQYVVGKIYPDYVDFRSYDLSQEDFLGPNYLACRAGDPAQARLQGSRGKGSASASERVGAAS